MNVSPQHVRSLVERARSIFTDEFGQFRMNLQSARLISRMIPAAVPPREANAIRVALLRQMGFSVGEGTVFAGMPNLQATGDAMKGMLEVGHDCSIDLEVTFDLGERITLGNSVTIGHQVLLLTTSHELGPRVHRAGPVTRQPIKICDGAWIGARAVILPGITVGAGAVVAPGTLVTKDVPEDTRVGGVPAKGGEKLAP
ncbi:MAG: acyltransferase [Myxococcales bacterium]